MRIDIQCGNCGSHRIISLTKEEIEKAHDVPYVVKHPVCRTCAKV